MKFFILLFSLALGGGNSFANDHGHEHGGEHHEQESEQKGFQISPEAAKNFELTFLKVGSGGQVEIPSSAIVTAGTEVNVYRRRDGFFSRIDFEKLGQTAKTTKLRSAELKPGDEIAVTGTGFLRLTEIAAFGGAPTGHSH